MDPSRYRVTLHSQTFFTPDIYLSTDINKLSDEWMLHDFFPSEYRLNRNPDNIVALTDRSENYTITGLARIGLNDFMDTTERLPEVALDVKRQPLFGSQIFYEGQTSAADLKRNFASLDISTPEGLAEFKKTHGDWKNYVLNDGNGSPKFVDFQAIRLDTFHQLVAPQTLGGWLNVIPRVGVRATYYSKGATEIDNSLIFPPRTNPNLDLTSMGRELVQRENGGSVFRPVFNAGVDTSFKISREWEDVQSRSWGLDGLRHVIQPYADFSFVRTNKDPGDILQFDRINPSTQLPPIDFPQFTTIDTLPDWSILRLGMRNRLETRRDDKNFTWLELDSFFDTNIENPNFPVEGWNTNTFSNIYNRLLWSPLTWASFQVDSQLPLLNTGFTEVNTGVNFMPNEDFRFSVSHRYLEGNPYFNNSSNIRVSAFYRINDNWGVGVSEQYELTDSTLERQDYEIYRDLSSWVASLGFMVRESYNTSTKQRVTDTGVVLTFSLKDLPSFGLPLHFDPTSVMNDASGSGNTTKP